MKILEIIPQLGSGGAERFTVDLCNELVNSGHDVTLAVLYPLNDGLDFYRQELDCRIKLIELNKKPGIDFGLMFRIKKFIKEQNPDVVHTHLRAIYYTALANVRLHKNIKFYHTVHNDAAKEATDRAGAAIRRYLFRKKYTTPVTISEESQRSFSAFYKLDSCLIPNGRNIPENISISDDVKHEFQSFRITPSTKVLMNLAHIDDVKRQDMLARIVDRLIKEGYDISLILVGRENNGSVLDAIKSLNNSNIHILGTRTNPLEYLMEADAFCLCSRYEGLPISLIEAMGVGTIPVCTPVGGIVDIIRNGKNGFLSKDISEDSYYDALKDFLDKPKNELQTIARETNESYKPFSMTECAEKYCRIFNN